MRAGAPKRTPERLRGERGLPGADHAGPKPGQTIGGRFRLERALDPAGLVWLAADDAGGRHVLKTGARDVVRHEFETLSNLRHPNIVAVRGLAESEDAVFVVLEYLPGGDLVSLAGFEARHWLEPLADVVEALDFLHRRGIVHRDLKARNVLLDEAGRARLTDFGSAQPAGSRLSVGGTTEAAVARSRGDGPVAVADDVYALASLVHELCYGAPPGLHRRKPAPAGPGKLASLVQDCLDARDPDARPDLRDFRAVVRWLMGEQREPS